MLAEMLLFKPSSTSESIRNVGQHLWTDSHPGQRRPWFSAYFLYGVTDASCTIKCGGVVVIISTSLLRNQTFCACLAATILANNECSSETAPLITREVFCLVKLWALILPELYLFRFSSVSNGGARSLQNAASRTKTTSDWEEGRLPDRKRALSTVNSWANRMWQKFFLLLRMAVMSPHCPNTSMMSCSVAFSGRPPTNTVLHPGGRSLVAGGGRSVGETQQCVKKLCTKTVGEKWSDGIGHLCSDNTAEINSSINVSAVPEQWNSILSVNYALWEAEDNISNDRLPVFWLHHCVKSFWQSWGAGLISCHWLLLQQKSVRLFIVCRKRRNQRKKLRTCKKMNLIHSYLRCQQNRNRFQYIQHKPGCLLRFLPGVFHIAQRQRVCANGLKKQREDFEEE